MKNSFVGIAGAGMLLLIGYFWLQSHLGGVEEIASQPERGTIVGTYVCLPLREENVQEGDCASGVRSDTGGHYAIDLGLMSQDAPALVEGDRFTASGIITPIETLSTDYWRKYDVEAIFSVTDSLQKLVSEMPEHIALYTGMLPCASCAGIETTLELFSEHASATEGVYKLSSLYVGDSAVPVITEGSWVRTNQAASSTIVLNGKQGQPPVARYQVQSESVLRLLAQDGSSIESDMSYELTMRSPATTETLFEPSWVWQYSELKGAKRVTPEQTDAFVLKLNKNASYTSTTDCNSLSGTFVVDQEVLSLSQPASTKMFCADSQEQTYREQLQLANSFFIREGQLHLNLDRDYGTMVFKSR